MTTEKVRVLLLEDNPREERLIRELLHAASQYPRDYPRFEIECTGHLHEGLARLATDEIDVVLFNLRLMDSDQWATFTALQAYAAQVPLIMLTGYDEEEWGLRAVQQGAQDYIPKGELTGRLVARAMRYAIERHRLETELRQHRAQLEEQVAARTAELEETITRLHHEMAERQRAAQAWRASTAEFQTIFEMALSMICIADIQQFTFLRVNPAFTTILGYQEEELLARPFLDFVHPDDVADTIAVVEAELRKGTPVIQFINRYRAKDGTYHWLDWNSHPVPEQGITFAIAHDITARKQMEGELRVSLTKYRTILDSFPLGVTISDAAGHIVESNREAEHLLGLPAAEHADRHIAGAEWRIVRPDGTPLPAEEYASVRALKEQRVIANVELGIVKEDDQVTWLNVTAAPLPLEDYGVAIAYGDITARKQAEETQRESAAFLDTLLNAIPIPVFYKDHEGRYLGFNNAFETFFGETREHLVGKSVFDISPPELAEIYHAQDNALLEKGGTQRYESQVQDAQGILHDVVFNKAVFTDSQGIAQGLIGGILDITARKQAENELRESAQRYRTLLESINDSIAVIDPDFEIVQMNQAMERDTGKGSSHIGERCFAAFYEAEAPCEWCPAQMVLTTGQEQSAIVPFPADEPRQWFHLKAFPMWNTRGELTHIIEVARDITAIQQTELQLEEYATKLERSNADLQQFAYTVSHDLQTPLRMVTSFLGLLEKQYRASLDAKAQEYIDFAVTSARQMSALIHDLLQYTRLDSRGQEPAPLDTAALLDEVWPTLRLQIAECEAEITPAPLPVVYADKTQVRQLLQNLLGNALKFRQPDVPPRIHIAVERQGDQWQFAVRDNGIGIAPRYHEHIFTIFQRGAMTHNNEYAGTGVGLAICQKIVERHGGRIWLESAEGQGATFYFTLPAVPEAQEAD